MIFSYKLEQDPGLDESIRSAISATLTETVTTGNATILVALNDNKKVVGFINYHEIVFPMIAGKELYISDLLVDKNERGKKTGKKLIDEVDKTALSKGCKRLMLNNLKLAESYTRGFYRKSGFEERINIANFVKNY